MRNVLITGASGFIGFHTVQEFIDRGCFVYALVHKAVRPELIELEKENKVKILKSDVTSFALLNEVFKNLPQLKAIVHCAGRASDVGWDSSFRKVNFESVKHLVELTKIYNVDRFVFISTTDVYGIRNFSGETESELPYVKKPRNPYPKFKILAEQYIKEHLLEDKYCFIRPAAVWGEDDPTLTKRFKDYLSKTRYIVHFGKWKGQNRWPLVHVDKVAIGNYIGAFHKHSQGLAINIIDDKRTTLDEFYRIVGKMYFQEREFKTITFPYWIGFFIGCLVSLISNLFNLKNPIADPSLYAFFSITSDLDFNSEFYDDLKNTLENNE